jgi:hypothetical protein
MRKVFTVIGLIFFVWLAVASIPAHAATQLDMLNCSGLPCVNVQLASGKTTTLMLDTGNAVSMLDLKQARDLGLTLEPYKTDDGKVVPDYFLAKVTDAKLGDQTLAPVTFLVVDLSKSLDKGVFPQSAGTLSYVDLKDRIVTLDYRHHKVEISGSNPASIDPPKNAATLSYPTFGHHGPPIVATTGFSVNNQPITVQIDTLYTGSMLIYGTSIQKLNLTTQAGSSIKMNFPYTDGGVDMLEGTASHESFNGKTLLARAQLFFPTPKVHQPDGMFDGTVGNELFNGHRLTFDFPANRFWID